ncbi:thioredoxin family protein [Derxia lacustris]|uniref:thioredoxin family protein n=1 Tax=Derxia lacustris TaxID=764842 RepID=UPI000A174D1E|nr:co-chaperone YbbN [Derxia lacustris]
MSTTNIATFQQDVVEASLQVPVLVDFWAPWCGPCKTLGPMLERLEAEYAGRFKLVKVDSDENPELSQAFRIRSIPYVVAFVGGRPVDQFMGALSEGELREFIERLVPNPSDAEHAKARDLLEQGDVDGAVEALRTAIALDPANDMARLDLVSLLLDRGDANGAEGHLATLSPRTTSDPEFAPHVEALRTHLEALKQQTALPAAPELEARIAANGADLEARKELAQLYIAHQAWEPALEQLLQIVQTDRAFDEDYGRRTMIQVFDLAADNAPLVSRFRRALSSSILR